MRRAAPGAVSILRRQAVFGGADGLVLVVGLIVALQAHPVYLVHSAFAGGAAELVGMTAGAWLSESRAGFLPALANGAASLAACVLPAVPWLLAGGTAAASASLAVVAGEAAVIAWLRPERGWRAVLTTCGVLAGAAALSWLISLALPAGR